MSMVLWMPLRRTVILRLQTHALLEGEVTALFSFAVTWNLQEKLLCASARIDPPRFRRSTWQKICAENNTRSGGTVPVLHHTWRRQNCGHHFFLIVKSCESPDDQNGTKDPLLGHAILDFLAGINTEGWIWDASRQLLAATEKFSSWPSMVTHSHSLGESLQRSPNLCFSYFCLKRKKDEQIVWCVTHSGFKPKQDNSTPHSVQFPTTCQ